MEMINRMSNVTLPPYGVLSEEYAGRLRLRPVVPPDWKIRQGCDSSCRAKQWQDFKDETIAIISEVLWPRYDPVVHKWSGAAAEFMVDLTRLDLEFVTDLRTRPVQPLDMLPETPVRAIDCPEHRQFFLEEDNDNKAFLDMYKYYDRSLDDKMIATFPDACGDGMTRKVSSASLQFKSVFQRPRAYQTAMIFGIQGFTHELALSSMTPSMSCGHCLQAMLGVGTIMERIILGAIPFSDESWLALEQHAVDIGDRRDMAGVHYPTDNIASWIIALRMAPHVFRTSEVAPHLWHAISKRSFIYQELLRWAEKPEGYLYRRPLQLLSETAEELIAG
jgi:hypothetical protein